MGLDGVQQSVALQTPADWALILFSALGPGALSTFMQTKAQAAVSATAAQARPAGLMLFPHPCHKQAPGSRL